MTVKLAQYLYDNWEPGVDLYTVNIPLCDELAQGKCKIVRTKIHQGKSLLYSFVLMVSSTFLPVPAYFCEAGE